MSPLLISVLMPRHGRHVVPVRHLRHGRRHDPDRHPARAVPVPEAMMLHGVTQMASNGWRGLLWWRHVRWSAVGAYVFGCVVALGAVVVHALRPGHAGGAAVARADAIPGAAGAEGLSAEPREPLQGGLYGMACITLILMTGVAGPLIDQFFLGGKFDRREIVATKAMCQISARREAHLFRQPDRPGGIGRSDRRGAGDRQLDGRHHARQARARGDVRPAVSPLGQRNHHGDCRILRRPRHDPDRSRARLRALTHAARQRRRSVSTR